MRMTRAPGGQKRRAAQERIPGGLQRPRDHAGDGQGKIGHDLMGVDFGVGKAQRIDHLEDKGDPFLARLGKHHREAGIHDEQRQGRKPRPRPDIQERRREIGEAARHDRVDEVLYDDVLKGHQARQVGLGVFLDELFIKEPEPVDLKVGQADPRPGKELPDALFALLHAAAPYRYVFKVKKRPS